MGGNLFEGLPPPSHSEIGLKKEQEAPLPLPSPPPPSLRPALKSALKRSKPVEPQQITPKDFDDLGGPGKKLRFKTTTDASEQQVIDAMQKISSHINNLSKFSKASKLAVQLVQAGSVKPGTIDHFFGVLEAAMSIPTSCNVASVRSDYHALFSVVQDAAECFDNKQKLQLEVWTIRAVVANDLFTDDSFLFSKTAKTVRDTISNLPVATEDDDTEEAAALKDEKASAHEDSEKKKQDEAPAERRQAESDPFGLDALIPSNVKKEERSTKSKKDAASKMRKEEETRGFLRSKREALISCLEIAAKRYKNPWCQTVIDILVKHAYDNVAKFTSKQREAIGKLWDSIREQQARRKQGKSVTGKLDVTAFEWLQEKYSTEKISIRRAVGGSGDRRAQQWLG